MNNQNKSLHFTRGVSQLIPGSGPYSSKWMIGAWTPTSLLVWSSTWGRSAWWEGDRWQYRAHLVPIALHNEGEVDTMPEDGSQSIRTSEAESIREVQQREQGPDLQTQWNKMARASSDPIQIIKNSNSNNKGDDNNYDYQ